MSASECILDIQQFFHKCRVYTQMKNLSATGEMFSELENLFYEKMKDFPKSKWNQMVIIFLNFKFFCIDFFIFIHLPIVKQERNKNLICGEPCKSRDGKKTGFFKKDQTSVFFLV